LINVGATMSGEPVFSVDGSKATPATPITLAEAGLRERQELQEWVIEHPDLAPTIPTLSPR